MFQAMKYKKRIQDKDTTLYGHIDMTKFQKVGHEYNIDTEKFMCARARAHTHTRCTDMNT